GGGGHGPFPCMARQAADMRAAVAISSAAAAEAGIGVGPRARDPGDRGLPWRCDLSPRGKAAAGIRFKATLQRPAQPKGASWRFLVLPAAASARLPTRSMVTVDGTLEGQPFQATLEPDGQGSHWLKVER